MTAKAKPAASAPAARHKRESYTRLLLLPDGRVLVHNLTPAMARILQKLNPGDRLIRRRRLVVPPLGSAAARS